MTFNNFSLGKLALANGDGDMTSLDLDKADSSQLLMFLESMMRIRAAEKKLAEGRRLGLIGGPVHLGVGQEAVAVGVSASLKSTDMVFGAHRSHSHVLALGSSVYGLFAEVLGRRTGLSRGMGGSMHLWDQPKGFYGSVPIVAGTVSLAVGAGLAARLQNKSDVAIAYFGDGAIEEGVVHESMNFARINSIPVVFILENNLFASHMHISMRQPKDSTARFAYANDVDYRVVDGNNIIAVANASRELVENARSGAGPGFIEAVTYRWFGHVDWREDIDVGVNRSQSDLAIWKMRDPILRLITALISKKLWTDSQNTVLEAKINNEIDEAWEAAIKDPYPDENSLLSYVYANL